MQKSLYCSEKFNSVELKVESRSLFNCCWAHPERIDLEKCDKDPTLMLCSDQMVKDRTLMLQNKKFHSCDHGCFKHEDLGKISERLKYNNQTVTSTDVHKIPSTVTISLSSDCNLSCVYCVPDLSSSWRRQVKEHGQMGDNIYTPFNKLQDALKQKQRSSQTKFLDILMRAIEINKKHIKRIKFTGGEPLLNSTLYDLIEKINNVKIVIISGLGVSDTQLDKCLKNIKGKNVEFQISGEATGKHFEFIRYGNNWENFNNKIKKIQSAGVPITCIMSISNLSIFSCNEYYEHFKNFPIIVDPVNNPSFMSMNVLDDKSKQEFLNKDTNHLYFENTIQDMSVPYTENDRLRLQNYLKQLVTVRNVDLQIFPQHFLDWVNN